jgi:antitoxin component YwqK of YwqJK toxin-antitoxin module
MQIQFNDHQRDFDVKNQGLMFENQPFTGSLHRDAGPNNGQAVCQYTNGLKNGVFKEWYINGKIKEVSLFRDNELHGRRICYWPNGTKRFHVNYINGQMDGVYEEFNNNGMTKQIKTYYKGKLICVRKNQMDLAV